MGVAAAFLASCMPLELEPPEAPAADGKVVAGYGNRPRVTGIAATGTDDGLWYVTYNFSRPMAVSATEQQLRLAPVLGTDGFHFNLGNSIRPQELFGFAWDVSSTSVTVLFDVGSRALWRPIVEQGAEDIAGLQLDGTAASGSGGTENLGRDSEDGFAAPASHIGLPFLTRAITQLSDLPRLRLNQDRATLEVELYSASGAVTRSTADGYNFSVSGAPARIHIRLLATNSRPLSSREPYRQEPELFSLQAITAVSLVDARGVKVPVLSSWDIQGHLPVGAGARITETGSSPFLGLAPLLGHQAVFPGKTALMTSAQEPPALIYPAWAAVTGGVLFSAPVYAGHAVGIAGTSIIVDGSARWRANEWVLMTTYIDNFPFKVVANSAASLTLANTANCASGCDYRIELTPSIRFRAGTSAYIAGDTLIITPAPGSEAPLPWTLRIDAGQRTGMRDLYGVPTWDGIRDGDESAGIANDTMRFTLGLP